MSSLVNFGHGQLYSSTTNDEDDNAADNAARAEPVLSSTDEDDKDDHVPLRPGLSDRVHRCVRRRS